MAKSRLFGWPYTFVTLMLKHEFLIYVTSLEFNNIFSFEGKYGSDAHVSL